MANLPECGLLFSVDYFGPWYIKEGSREVKHYRVLFTFLASRAVHLEIASSLPTDSFVSTYRRFVGRHGSVQQLRSDQGANFIGSRNQLQQRLAMFEYERIQPELVKRKCDWIDSKTNVPEASHMGGE